MKTGAVLFWIFFIFFLIPGIILVIYGISLSDESSGPGYYLAGVFSILGLIGCVVGGSIAFLGIILFLTAKAQEQQKNLEENEPGENQNLP